MTPRHAEHLTTAKARMARWRAKHGARLASMHPDVALEVQSVVWTRFLAGGESGMSDTDLHQCRMRVASRIRLKSYGRCDGDEECARQLREVLAGIDGHRREMAA